LHSAIRAYKPPYRRIVVAGVVKVQAGVVQPLAGKQLVRIYSALTISADSKGESIFWVAPAERASIQIFDAIKRKKRVYILHGDGD
jgi:hypothetical protein